MRPTIGTPETVLAVVGLLFLLGWAIPAWAVDTGAIDGALKACLQAHEDTAGMVECQASAIKQWDAALNAAYQDLMRTLSDQGRTNLREAQRDWIKFKDAELTFLRGVFQEETGTIWAIVSGSQVIDLLRQRTVQLRCRAKMTDMAGPPDPDCP
jgi:uncharacterized protein YecT (DUF1311 family)